MNRLYKVTAIAVIFCLLAGQSLWAGEVDVLVNKLVEKGVLSPSEAQIVADETKVQVSKDLAQMRSYSTPDWTQRIKMSGDVRFRTQYDSGKGNTNTTGGPTTFQDERYRNRVRGRFALEAKVNDFTYAGTRLAGGNTNSRSTNDTLDDYFGKKFVMFDQYYIRFEMPQDLARSYSQYVSDAKLWAGKFPIPYEYSEIMWDSDTNPGGVAFQYVSPDMKICGMPEFNGYFNGAMLWLQESANLNTDPILWAPQVGIKTAAFGPLDSTLNVATAFYDFANLQNKTPTNSSNTNSRIWRADLGGPTGSPAGSSLWNTLKYEYMVFDLLIQIDNAKFMDKEFPHGFYADFLNNTCAPEGQAFEIGAYIGKKKLKEKGDWKVRGEWRYIERDAVPDFMPDSDFYGFGTWSATGPASGVTTAGNNGYPAEGGTNGKGINMALEYMLFKNTTLNIEYYWMKPIASMDRTAPWNELQLDIVTKF